MVFAQIFRFVLHFWLHSFSRNFAKKFAKYERKLSYFFAKRFVRWKPYFPLYNCGELGNISVRQIFVNEYVKITRVGVILIS